MVQSRVTLSKKVLLLTACKLALTYGMRSAIAQDAPAATGSSASSAAPTAASRTRPAHHRIARRTAAPSQTPAAPSQAAIATPRNTPGRSAIAGTTKAAGPDAADSGETVIVTGTRNLGRKARDSTSPIDVISAQALTRTGQPTLQDQLSRTNPAINVKAHGNDTEALVSAIQLRGLSPNETLVLVDGVRRHPTSNIYADPGPATGATPVDINMIPASAIDHIEILRDGAAAQYGSDAIAGVVNIILKKTGTGGHASAFTGASAYNGDGWQTQLDFDQGLSFGNDGYVHLGGQFYHTDNFVQQAVDDRAVADKFEPDSNKINSIPEETRETFSLSSGTTLSPTMFDGLQAYSLITYGHRHSEGYENYRTPQTLPDLYPTGFSPMETVEENDYSAMVGLKAGDVFGFRVNLSTVYGEDDTNIGNKDTANSGLGTSATAGYPYYPAFFTPTTVLAESQKSAQWTSNLDFVRTMRPWGKQTNLAFGIEERSEVYRLGAGAPASYLDGGTQGYAGLLPSNAGNYSRNVYAAYLDYDIHPLKHWDLDFAGRFEHYTDFDNTENGKISSRYDFTKWLALRGTISNGFRAPTLAEENYSFLNVAPTGASGILAANSSAARLLGATPLKPERSTNASAGIVLQPLSNLSVTVDVYQINIRDRIVAAGGVNGQQAINAIEASGASLPLTAIPDEVNAYYFSNGASTRTQGADIDVNYLADFRNRGLGTVTWTAGIDLNRTRLTHNGVDANGQPDLNAKSIGYLTTASPRSKIILNAFWQFGRYDFDLRQTRWGEAKNDLTYGDLAPAALAFSATQFLEFKTTPVWTTDLQAGYHLTDHLHVSIGANNILNERPRRAPAAASYLGVQYYDNTASTVPITGGFYYGQVNYTW